MLASLFVAGCASTTPPDILPAFNPADPVMGSAIRTIIRSSLTISHREPVDPQNWRRLNESALPAKPGSRIMKRRFLTMATVEPSR